jgi:hypothetical protein
MVNRRFRQKSKRGSCSLTAFPFANLSGSPVFVSVGKSNDQIVAGQIFDISLSTGRECPAVDRAYFSCAEFAEIGTGLFIGVYDHLSSPPFLRQTVKSSLENQVLTVCGM